jgi:hypothetical protein
MSVKSLTRQAVGAPNKAPGSFRVFAESFRRSLLAESKSPRTVKTYIEALTLLGEFLAAQGTPTELEAIHRNGCQPLPLPPAVLPRPPGSRRTCRTSVRAGFVATVPSVSTLLVI